MAMHLQLLLVAAFGALGTLQQATTCTTPTVTPNNPTPGATPTSISMCIPITAALTQATPSTLAVGSTILQAGTTVSSTVFPAGSTCTAPGGSWACVAGTPAGTCTYTLTTAGCTLAIGQSINVVFGPVLGVNPTQGTQYFTITQNPTGALSPTSTTAATSYNVGLPSPSPIQDSTATICAAVAAAIPSPQSACSLTQTQLSTLANQILGVSPTGQGVYSCPSTTYGTTYVYEYTNPIWAQTISSTGARSATITTWGNILANQMVALAVTYPVTSAVLQALNLNEFGVPNGATNLVPTGSRIEFLVRIERWTPAGVLANEGNPLNFIVAAGNGWQPVNGRPITTVIVSNPCTSASIAVTGAVGSWAMSALTGEVLVSAQRGGLFIGYSTDPLVLAPSSDEALLGLLALVALPFMCCCCLALWLWHRAKNAPFPCCGQNPCPCPCPMQECAVQQCMPIQTVPVATSVPPCTPVFPMPYY